MIRKCLALLLLALVAVLWIGGRSSSCSVCLRPWAIVPIRGRLGGLFWYCRRCARARRGREAHRT